ncbi:MAG: NAD(+)--dinitrogen-reductase ADP-D-ribosyltransferase [Opitutales bacterium]
MQDAPVVSAERPDALLIGHYNTMNLCELPGWVIASREFNTHPVPLEILGVRGSNRALFTRLEATDASADRARIFHEYLCVKFNLHHWSEYAGKARRSLRNSYRRFLNGWGMDSNGIEGAVLKSWVCSRFGIPPTYHRGILHPDTYGLEDERYARDRMHGRARTNAIDAQLDLLYEFCQYELQRRWPDQSTCTLYRGTNDPQEHLLRQEGTRRRSLVRLNNLVSFTADRERAWEFGSTVWSACVGTSKIIFFSSLLGGSLLQGEAEYLVIGGDYDVEELIF